MAGVTRCGVSVEPRGGGWGMRGRLPRRRRWITRTKMVPVVKGPAAPIGASVSGVSFIEFRHEGRSRRAFRDFPCRRPGLETRLGGQKLTSADATSRLASARVRDSVASHGCELGTTRTFDRALGHTALSRSTDHRPPTERPASPLLRCSAYSSASGYSRRWFSRSPSPRRTRVPPPRAPPRSPRRTARSSARVRPRRSEGASSRLPRKDCSTYSASKWAVGGGAQRPSAAARHHAARARVRRSRG